MEAVFGLVEHDGVWAVDDAGRDFLAAMGGQAVHDDGVGLGGGQELVVNLVGQQAGFALGGLGFLAHGGPDVGVEDVGVLGRSGRVAQDFDAAAGFFGN